MTSKRYPHGHRSRRGEEAATARRFPLLLADLQQIRDLGCNFIRGSHYPQDPRFLDLCDELGVCVWSETIGWRYPVELMREASFVEAQLEHLEEMVAAAAGRPSVIMWGVFNECPSYDPAARPAYERLLGRLKELDTRADLSPTRRSTCTTTSASIWSTSSRSTPIRGGTSAASRRCPESSTASPPTSNGKGSRTNR